MIDLNLPASSELKQAALDDLELAEDWDTRTTVEFASKRALDAELSERGISRDCLDRRVYPSHCIGTAYLAVFKREMLAERALFESTFGYET